MARAAAADFLTEEEARKFSTTTPFGGYSPLREPWLLLMANDQEVLRAPVRQVTRNTPSSIAVRMSSGAWPHTMGFGNRIG